MTARRQRPDRSVLLATIASILCLVVAPSVGADEKKTDVETLQALVREWINLQGQLQEEETRWQEQKAHLEMTLTLLRKEKASLDQAIASANKKRDESRSERERLSREIAAAKAPPAQMDKAIQEQGRRLLAVHDALPAPLRKPLSGASTRVRAALFGKKGDWTLPERLQLMVAFAADLDRVLGAVHLVKQVLDVGDSGAREVDVLYLGGAVGYYISPDGRESGLLTRGGKGWTRTARNELAPAVRRAIAVFRKERPAALVDLPVEVRTAGNVSHDTKSEKRP